MLDAAQPQALVVSIRLLIAIREITHARTHARAHSRTHTRTCAVCVRRRCNYDAERNRNAASTVGPIMACLKPSTSGVGSQTEAAQSLEKLGEQLLRHRLPCWVRANSSRTFPPQSMRDSFDHQPPALAFHLNLP